MTEEVRLVNGKPIFSSSEEVAYKTCKLGHYFEYVLGYGPTLTNRKLSVGIAVHEGLEVLYKGGTDAEVTAHLLRLSEERWAEIEAAHPNGVDAETRVEYIRDRDLIIDMVTRYRTWAIESKLDDGYDIVAVEEHHYIEIPGAPCVLPIKLDLLQRSKRTGRLRIVDFKTAASFSQNSAKYQLSEQNGNYQLGIMAVYDERPTELEYRELRKMSPNLNPKSKPPYFRATPIRLTADEMRKRLADYVATANERFAADPEAVPVANPSACCGSWKNDWATPCLSVHAGTTPLEALELSTKHSKQDTYARYDKETEA